MQQDLALGLLWYAVFIVSLTSHEAAHALTALRCGDPTAYDAGLVTLDPVAHIRRSPFGMVIVPIASFFLGGWMMGWASTPYEPHWAQSHRKYAALMALAGPAANLVLILIAALLIRGGMLAGWFKAPQSVETFEQITTAGAPGMANGAAILVSVLFSLNLILLVFNLLPLPPLDGSEIVTLFLDDSTAERYRAVMGQPTAQMVGLIVAWHLIDFLLDPARLIALNLLYPGAGYH
ncbi:MAG: site-2 protease family protein [Phycisphaerales bacterium]|nr:MAG: site-2 protease family protein [Phycisphaerales bacterium]